MPNVEFDLPDLAGKSLDEHFYKLGMFAAEPYLSKAKKFSDSASTIPEMPKPSEWLKKSGWTKYAKNESPVSVDYPDEDDSLVFDTEVLYKISDFAVLAVAVSEKAWYCWVSPWVLGETSNPRQLIPLGKNEHKIVIGHNVSYDRKRIKEEYDINLTNTMFIDTMSLHIAVSGMCSRQRPDWIKYDRSRKLKKQQGDFNDQFMDPDLGQGGPIDSAIEVSEENPWVNFSCLNSLADVGFLHCGITHDKNVRDYFGELDCKGVMDNFAMLVDYCARDVGVTFKVYKALFPRFLAEIPHPVSFAALRHMGSLFLPINKSWNEYIKKAEDCYQKAQQEVYNQLVALAETAVALKDTPEKWQQDPWLKQLDWTIAPIRMTKGTKKQPPRPVKRQKLPGYPKWYKDLFPSASSPINLTVRQRTSHLLMRLQWDGRPIMWSDEHGFVFKAKVSDKEALLTQNYTFADMNNEKNMLFKDDPDAVYFKVPHKEGPKARCINPMGNSYRDYFERGILSSTYDMAAKAIQTTVSCSYWEHNRERVRNQMTVWSGDTDMGVSVENKDDFGMILPSLVTMGTVTRRAVENTWLTASNAKKNRIGSEQKAMIRAPPGYKFVGADVDSEELWIASLIGDSIFKMHGGTALGWMTLEGTKSEGTDLHSKTASILGISRNEAKIFNYGRIYGAGVKFAAQLLKEFNPSLSEADANSTAKKLYEATKGSKSSSKVLDLKSFWRKGSESLIFNRLESLANQDKPRTPVLGAAITETLLRRNLKKSTFMTSRINWSIQSSGVDYLHLLITSMHYLINKYDIQARLFITVHDEIRYMVKEEDVDRACLALQISNIWTRAMFCEQVGISELPYSCAFFSAVDIDHVFRKEVDLDCVTLSHPTPIEPGSSLDIFGLVERCSTLKKTGDDGSSKRSHEISKQIESGKAQYKRIPTIIEEIDRQFSSPLAYVGAQVARTGKELREVEFIAEHPEASWDIFFEKKIPKSKKNDKSLEITTAKSTMTESHDNVDINDINEVFSSADKKELPTRKALAKKPKDTKSNSKRGVGTTKKAQKVATSKPKVTKVKTPQVSTKHLDEDIQFLAGDLPYSFPPPYEYYHWQNDHYGNGTIQPMSSKSETSDGYAVRKGVQDYH